MSQTLPMYNYCPGYEDISQYWVDCQKLTFLKRQPVTYWLSFRSVSHGPTNQSVIFTHNMVSRLVFVFLFSLSGCSRSIFLRYDCIFPTMKTIHHENHICPSSGAYLSPILQSPGSQSNAEFPVGSISDQFSFLQLYTMENHMG